MSKKQKFRSRKVLASLLATSFILAGLVGFQFGLASFQGSEESVPKYLESTLPYSYIIDTNTTHYFMYNGTTWKEDWSSTNFTNIFNACSGNLTSGGSIFIKAGDYDGLNGTLYMVDNLLVEGEGYATKITLADNARQIYQAQWETMRMISSASGDRIHNVTVRDIHFDMNRDNQVKPGMIMTVYGYHVTVENCYFMNFNGTGVHPTQNSYDLHFNNNFFNNGKEAMWSDHSHDIWFEDNYIENMWGVTGVAEPGRGLKMVNSAYPGTNAFIRNNIFYDIQYAGMTLSNTCNSTISNNIIISRESTGYSTFKVGIQTSGTFLDNIIENNYIYNVEVTAGGYAMDFNSATGGNNTIRGNHIVKCPAGIYVRMPFTDCSNNVIHSPLLGAGTGYGINVARANCTIQNNKIHDQLRGIYLEATGDDTIIEYNDFRYNTNGVVNSGQNNIIRWNHGYVTENSGSQTVANNENIAHGLVSTPVYYSVTCLNETYDGEPVAVWLDYSGIDATNLNVCVYWLNGTAITDDVILVAWEARTWN